MTPESVPKWIEGETLGRAESLAGPQYRVADWGGKLSEGKVVEILADFTAIIERKSNEHLTNIAKAVHSSRTAFVGADRTARHTCRTDPDTCLNITQGTDTTGGTAVLSAPCPLPYNIGDQIDTAAWQPGSAF